MITSLEDLVVSLSSDAAMIGAVAGLYALLRKAMRTAVREEITTTVTATIREQIGDGDTSPREVIDGLRDAQHVTSQAVADLRGDLDGVSRRLDGLRTMFFSHIDRSHQL